MRVKAKTVSLFSILLFASATVHGEVSNTSGPLEDEPARMLAAEAYCGSTECLKQFEPVSPSPNDGPFVLFEGLSRTAGAFGYFAVNRWTGDVWTLWTCKQIGTPASRRTKSKFLKQLKSEDMKNRRKFISAQPDCS